MTNALTTPNVLESVLSFLSVTELAKALTTCKDFRKVAGQAFRILLHTTQTQDSLEKCRQFSANTLHKPVTRKEILDQMASITYLNLDSGDLVSDSDRNNGETVGRILSSENAKRLTRLRVSLPSNARYLTGECVQAIASRCLQLSELSLHWSHIPDESTGCLADLKRLQKVSFRCSYNIGDQTLATLTKIPSVTDICFADCEKITHVGIATLLQNAPQLRFLDVGGAAGGHYAFDGQAEIAQAIAQHGQQLVRLDMHRGCYRNAEILEIARGCQSLTFIDLGWMSSDTLKNEQELAKAMREANPRLEVRGLEPPPAPEGKRE